MMRRPHAARGFTLIEVLVALVIMATMSLMAWRGIDTILRARDSSQERMALTTRLQTVMAQWEQDLRQLQDSGHPAAPGLQFDGVNLRIVRQHPQGLQLVVWTVREQKLRRYEAPPSANLGELVEQVKRSQQLLSQNNTALLALEGVSAWHLYYYRGNAWSNALSSDDEDSGTNTETQAPPQGASSPGGGASGVGTGSAGGTPPPARKQLPSGVRMQLQFAPGSGFAGPLVRQVLLGSSS